MQGQLRSKHTKINISSENFNILAQFLSGKKINTRIKHELQLPLVFCEPLGLQQHNRNHKSKRHCEALALLVWMSALKITPANARAGCPIAAYPTEKEVRTLSKHA